MRVVGTLTTLPSRYKLVLKMLKQLRHQTVKLDAIYLTLPYKAKRLNQTYPKLPDKIKKLCTVVRIDYDYGPICKLYGALMHENDPNTMIISLDDDIVYHHQLIETLIYKSKLRPKSAITGSAWLVDSHLFFNFYSNVTVANQFQTLVGMQVPDHGRKIDILVGSSGVLYKRFMFPCKEKIISDFFSLSLMNDDLFLNDDVVISAYLCKNKINRYVFKNIPVTNNDIVTNDALSIDYKKMLISFFNAVQFCKNLDYLHHCEDMSITDSPVFKVISITMFVLIIIIIIYIIIKHQQNTL
ncbi:MAG TPA: hypothetical protein VLG50_06645 [Candidatus Saccharimonadales bacterium]|nr:hypothetical protein [Candidatus Saccharimonadales bacterium]